MKKAILTALEDRYRAQISEADLYLFFLNLLTNVCFFTRLTLLIADFVFGISENVYIFEIFGSIFNYF